MTFQSGGFRRRLVRGSAVIFVFGVVATVLAVLRSIIVARLLADPDLIGLLAIYASFTATFGVLASFGIPPAVTRYFGQFAGSGREDLPRLIGAGFLITSVLSLGLGTLLFALSGFLATELYSRPDLAPLLQLGAISVVILGMTGFFTGALRGLQRMGELGIVQVLGGSLVVISSYVFVMQFGVVGAVYAFLLSGGGALTLSMTLVMRTSRGQGLRYLKKPGGQSIVEVTKYVFPLVISGLVLAPALLAVQSFLAIRFSFHDLGLYRIGYGLHSLLISVPGVLAVPLMPMIAEMGERHPDRVNPIFTQILRLLIFVMLPIAGVLTLSSSALIRILYGDVYVDAHLITSFLIMTALFISLSPITSSLLLGTGRTFSVLLLDLLGTALFLPAAFVLVDFGGLLGLGIAHLLAAVAFFVAKLSYLRRVFGLDLGPFVVPLGLAIFTLALLVALILSLPVEVTGLLSLPVGIGLAAASLLLLTSAERSMLFRAIRDLFP